MRILGASVASIVVIVGAVVALAAGGIAFTKLGPWYWNLRKPAWQPPDALFGPAWTTIFVLIGWSAIIGWNSPRATGGQRQALAAALAVNFALNLLWSFLFFTKRRPDFALVEVAVFWLSIVFLIAVMRPLSTLGAWLLAPYLGWVSFASVLNQRIVALNGPFPNR
jgi:tryptophan-rich sensory protein